MQATVIFPLMRSAARCVSAISSGVSGTKFSIYPVLSSTCASELIPESTTMTFSCVAAKRIAHDGADISGAAS